MKPQVNLRPDLLAQHRGVSPNTMIKTAALLVLAAVLINGTQALFAWQKLHQRELWQQRLNDSTAELEKTEQAFPNAAQKLLLEDQITALENEIQSKQQLLTLISTGDELQTKGFYAYLEALSKNSRRGLWLTEIEIVPKENRVRLKGVALQSDLVPQYLQDLRNSHFSGIQFGHMSMTQLDDSGRAYEFELDTPSLITAINGGTS